MSTQLALEKWIGTISTVTIGAKKEEGGSRSCSVKIGGETGLPLLFNEGKLPNKPKIAFEVWDVAPLDWADELLTIYGKEIGDPFAWAEKCVNEYRAELLCIKMQGAHPDSGNKSPDEAAKFIAKLLTTVNVPLIIIGSDDQVKDNLIMPAVSEAARKERCLIGCALQDN
ncbi:MAG: acetyl-CoA decarbonylase/synthase complex subunit delta, partial [Candidatus Omnitrophota bacterium]